jgi:hypothetical protein
MEMSGMRKNDKALEQKVSPVPRAMQVQLSRLFRSESKNTTATRRSRAEWRKTLKSVLAEIERYVAENVDTDELHLWMLRSGLAAAYASLEEEDFWPGYTEGITRLALTLLGDYPDHKKQKHRRKQDNHYSLKSYRSAQWVQTPEQRFRTLFAVDNVGYPKVSARPRDVLDDFRRRFGFKPSHADFLDWYRTNFAHDYAAIFR